MLTVCYHIIFHAIFLMAAIRNWGVMTNVGLMAMVALKDSSWIKKCSANISFDDKF